MIIEVGPGSGIPNKVHFVTMLKGLGLSPQTLPTLGNFRSNATGAPLCPIKIKIKLFKKIKVAGVKFHSASDEDEKIEIHSSYIFCPRYEY